MNIFSLFVDSDSWTEMDISDVPQAYNKKLTCHVDATKECFKCKAANCDIVLTERDIYIFKNS